MSTTTTLTPPPLTLLGDALVVSPSQLEQMKRCPQHWAFLNVHKRQANVPNIAAAAGKALHAALEVGYKLADREPALEVQARQREALHAGFRDLVLPDYEYRTEQRYTEVLDAYREHWQAEALETLGVELTFAVDLGSIAVPEAFWRSQNSSAQPRLRIILRGIIDRLLRQRDGTDVIFVGDSKTMKSWNDYGSGKTDEWAVNPQPRLYAYALNELQKQEPRLGLAGGVKGFLLDAIVIREPFSERTQASAALKAKARPRNEFHRHCYYYQPWELAEARDNALAWVAQVVQQHGTGTFLRNEHQCANWYGRRCPYWDVCGVPADQRALVLGSDVFKDKTERDWMTQPCPYRDEPEATP